MGTIFLPSDPFTDCALQDLGINPARAGLCYEAIGYDPSIEQVAFAINSELGMETSAGRLLVDPELGPEAMEVIHSMIKRIVLKPREDGGVAAVLEGDLARILALCAGAGHADARLGGGRSVDVPGCRLSVVAGARNPLELLFRAAAHTALPRQESRNVISSPASISPACKRAQV